MNNMKSSSWFCCWWKWREKCITNRTKIIL